MSTADVGKSHEQTLANMFRDAGWCVERIQGSGNRDGDLDNDLLMCRSEDFDGKHRYETRGTDDTGDTIFHQWKERWDLSREDVLLIEAKYRKKCGGFKKIYKKHFEYGGMSAEARILKWKSDDGYEYLSSPVKPLLNQVKEANNSQKLPLYPYKYSNVPYRGKMTNFVINMFEDDADYACVKGSASSMPMHWLIIVRRDNDRAN